MYGSPVLVPCGTRGPPGIPLLDAPERTPFDGHEPVSLFESHAGVETARPGVVAPHEQRHAGQAGFACAAKHVPEQLLRDAASLHGRMCRNLCQVRSPRTDRRHDGEGIVAITVTDHARKCRREHAAGRIPHEVADVLLPLVRLVVPREDPAGLAVSLAKETCRSGEVLRGQRRRSASRPKASSSTW